MARSSLIEVLGHDYIRTARAKGLRERAIVTRHALRNAAIPVLTTVGLQIGALLSGAVLVETVFARPGIGRLLLQGVQSRDFPLVQGLIFLIATVYVVVNTLVDLLYAWLDPRIRIE
jgi:peptide/nickel transport system permease protein